MASKVSRESISSLKGTPCSETKTSLRRLSTSSSSDDEEMTFVMHSDVFIILNLKASEVIS